MNKKVLLVGTKIKAMKIQGPENVARAGLDALKALAKTKYVSKRKFLEAFEESAQYLLEQSPTEAALRNAINYLHSGSTSASSRSSLDR